LRESERERVRQTHTNIIIFKLLLYAYSCGWPEEKQKDGLTKKTARTASGCLSANQEIKIQNKNAAAVESFELPMS
jgi:hypothetical protein